MMSISVKDSPFRNDEFPCIHASENTELNKFTCLLSCEECSRCRCDKYQPMDSKNYRNSMYKSLRPRWIRKEVDTYSYECCSRCGERLPRNQWGQSYYSAYCPGCGHKLYSEFTDELPEVDPGIYQHFKGRQYEVLGTGIHTETSEKFVAYRALYGKYQLYIRPLEMFVEDIESLKERYRGPRFFKVEFDK